jgi:hypothetical protein
MDALVVESQSAFAAKSVINGPKQSGTGGQDGANQFGQEQGHGVRLTCGLAEEPMESAPVPIADVFAGKDDLRHGTGPM